MASWLIRILTVIDMISEKNIVAGWRTAYIPYIDVPKDHSAYDAVNQLKALGIVGNHSGNAFNGDREVSRYEMALLLFQTLNLVKG